MALKAGGGVLIGLAAAVAAAKLHRKILDPLLDDAVSLLTPFVVVIVAEKLDTSSFVAVVVTGLYLGHRIPYLLSPTSRLQMDAVWRLITFLLEGIVFLLVGLQLRAIGERIETDVTTTVAVTAAVFGTLVVIRFVWMYPATYLARLVPRIRPAGGTAADRRAHRDRLGRDARRGHPRGGADAAARRASRRLPPGAVHLRGVRGDRAHPAGAGHHAAVAVAGGCGVRQDTSAEDALAEAGVQHQAGRAALQALEDEGRRRARRSVVERLRALVDSRSNNAWERLGNQQQETPSAAYGRLRREMISAERHVFKIARNEGRIPEEVLTRAQRELDLEESQLQRSDD